MLLQRISFVFCHQTITVYAISSPLFPTRKSSLCLSGQHKLHSPKITGIFNHWFLIIILFSCFMFLSEKYFSSITLAEKLQLKREIQTLLTGRNVLLRQAKAQQVLISAGHMPHLTLQCTLDVNALVVSFGNHQIKLPFYLSR